MSVCIAHRDGWIVADSRGNVGPVGITPNKVRKVFRSQGCLVSVVGEAIIRQQLEQLARSRTYAEMPEAISDWMFHNKNELNGDVLMVGYDRKLARIHGCGYICEITESDYWAIGCAAEWVLGYLSLVTELGQRVTVEHATSAIKNAARFDSGIDDRVQVFGMGG